MGIQIPLFAVSRGIVPQFAFIFRCLDSLMDTGELASSLLVPSRVKLSVDSSFHQRQMFVKRQPSIPIAEDPCSLGETLHILNFPG